MQKERFYEIGNDVPFITRDGRMGLLVLLPGDDGKVGIQVPGEDEHRWIPIENIEERGAGKGPLAEIGAPTMEEIAEKRGW